MQPSSILSAYQAKVCRALGAREFHLLWQDNSIQLNTMQQELLTRKLRKYN